MFKKHEDKKEKTENKKSETTLVNRESICATCAIFALLAFLILCTKTLIFGQVGEAVHIFLTGALGYLAYPLILGALYLSLTGLFGVRLVKNRRLAWLIGILFALVALIVHTLVTYSWAPDGYLKACFLSGKTFPNTAPCGILGGLLIFAVASVMTKVGTLVLLCFFALFFCYLLVVVYRQPLTAKEEKEKGEEQQPTAQQTPLQPTAERPSAMQSPSIQSPLSSLAFTEAEPRAEEEQAYVAPTVRQRPGVSLEDGKGECTTFGFSAEDASSPVEGGLGDREILFGGTPAENYRKNLLFDPTAKVNQRQGLAQPTASPAPTVERAYTPSYTSAYEREINESREEIRPSKLLENEQTLPKQTPYEVVQPNEDAYTLREPFAPATSPISPTVEAEKGGRFVGYDREEREEHQDVSAPIRQPQTEEYRRHDYMDVFSSDNPNVFGNDEESARFGREFADRALRNAEQEERKEDRRDGLHLLDDENEPYRLRADFDGEEPSSRTETPERTEREGTGFSTRDSVMGSVRGRGFEEEQTRGRGFEEERTPEPPKPEPKKPRIIQPYKRPSLDDFDCRDVQPVANDEEVRLTKENIIATLEEFKITGASIASVTFGPTVTRYNVTIPRSISPKKVVALDQSIAINLHSSGVNIYPNYEDGVVSIEVPNKERQFVQLGCMLSGDTFVNAKSSSLMFAMGKDVANRKVYGDISKMIHLLVAGSSGSGKSVCLGSLIISLIYKYSPEELRLILIDPKKTEFVLYNNLPHLMINEIITDAGKAVQSLNWAIGEMNRRYALFEKMSLSGNYVVNLDQYNENLDKSERLPKIVIIIDELADLMLAAKKEMEDRIQNLTQKARAAGIHLIVATQRPSTDVITGVIKSNLATRIAFYVATDVDSRVILDQTGAQKLLGKGDFLYSMPGINVPVRVQSAFISPEDSQRVVNYIKNNNEAYYDEEATAYINSRGGNGGDGYEGAGGGDGGVDPMYIDALRYVVQSNSASISMIQRKCSAGYNRAGKIIEWMEDMGYISPFDGAKARRVLITKEEFESKYGPL